MIRFRRIKIENFVCFDHLEFEPSIDPDRPLTVVRAENGSGKTTLLRSILWGMYGEAGLPSEAKNFGIHLAEWEPNDEGMRTSVEIEFENDGTTRSSTSSRREVTRYQLIRRVTTVIPAVTREGPPNFRREHESKELMFRSPGGRWERHEHGVDAVIAELLPIDLRDFFVMDADQVVDFVGGGENKHIHRREVINKTTSALHSLLGIDVFKDTSERVSKLARDFGASAARTIAKADLNQLQSELERLRKEHEEVSERLQGNLRSKADVEGQLEECNDRISDEAAGKGKLESLDRENRFIKNRLAELGAERESILGKLSLALESQDLLATMAIREIRGTHGLLKPLHDQGKIPQRHLAFVEDLLTEGICVCGQDLNLKSVYRQRVEDKLAEGRKDQDRANHLGNLYDSARILMDEERSVRWVRERKDLSSSIALISQQLENFGLELKANEELLANVDSEKIQQLQAEKGLLEKKLEDLNRSIGADEPRKPELERNVDSLEKKIDQRKRSEGAAKDHLQAEQLAKLVNQVLGAAYDRILHQQVEGLSVRMNRLFSNMAENVGDEELEDISERRATLKMITEVGIHRVEDDSFEIFARNRHGRLMPPTEVNGASRRVLALSFVLALCKESRTDAPLVADSLLNFMSGTVRRNSLRITAQQSSQPILLLTGADLEAPSEAEAVDRYAGATYTLTAQWHAREAGSGGDVLRQIKERSVSLLCNCGPRQYCDICEREGQANSPGWVNQS